MNRVLVAAAAAIAVVLSLDPSANAEVRKRWALDFDHDKPNTFTYRYQNGKSTNVWYMTYHVKNNSEMEAPLVFDLFLRTNRGKMVHHADAVDGPGTGVANLREVTCMKGLDGTASAKRLALKEEDGITGVQLDDGGYVSRVEGRVPL